MIRNRLFIGVIVLTGALVFCQQAVEPGKRPGFSETGELAVKRLVFMLKTLKTAEDIRLLVNQFSMRPTSLDSVPLNWYQWDPSVLVGGLSRGLKKQAASVEPIFGIAAGLQKSSATPVSSASSWWQKQPWWDSAQVDSLLLPMRSDARPFRIGLSFSPGPGWSVGLDTLIGRWDARQDDTVAVIDTVIHVRVRDSLSIATVDREVWHHPPTGLLKLLSKEQLSVDNGGNLLYRHKALVDGPVVYDTIFAVTDSGKLFQSIKRSDPTNTWWTSAGGSLVYEYRDSLVLSFGARVRSLVETQYAFDRAHEKQTIKLRTRFDYTSGDLDSVVTLTVYELVGSEQANYVSLKRDEYYRIGDRVSASIPSLVVTTQGMQCSLHVVHKPLPGNRIRSEFGLIDSSRIWSELFIAATKGEVTYSHLFRRDYCADPSVVRIDWEYIPDVPALWGAFTKRPSGQTIVTAYASASQPTESRRWRAVRRPNVDSLVYSWRGDDSSFQGTNLVRKTDSIRIEYNRSEQGIAYSVYEGGGRARAGVMSRGAQGVWSVTDTLDVSQVMFLRRIVDAQVDSLGRGEMNVVGIDNFTLTRLEDSMTVSGSGILHYSSGPFQWRKSGNSYVASVNDSGGRTSRFVFSVDIGGCLIGSFNHPGYKDWEMPSGRNLYLSPTGRGSGLLQGIFDFGEVEIERPEQARAGIQLHLWYSSEVSGTRMAQ